MFPWLSSWPGERRPWFSKDLKDHYFCRTKVINTVSIIRKDMAIRSMMQVWGDGPWIEWVSERCIKQKECVYGTCDKFLSLLIREKCLVHLRVVARQPHPRVMIGSPVISCLPASSCSASSSESFSPRVVSKWRSSALVIRPFPSWKHSLC